MRRKGRERRGEPPSSQHEVGRYEHELEEREEYRIMG